MSEVKQNKDLVEENVDEYLLSEDEKSVETGEDKPKEETVDNGAELVFIPMSM